MLCIFPVLILTRFQSKLYIRQWLQNSLQREAGNHLHLVLMDDIVELFYGYRKISHKNGSSWLHPLHFLVLGRILIAHVHENNL